MTREHVLSVNVRVRNRTNIVVRQLECSGCDLCVTFIISPAEQGDDFVRVLQMAHTRQIEEMTS